jgi:hypothetical protein
MSSYIYTSPNALFPNEGAVDGRTAQEQCVAGKPTGAHKVVQRPTIDSPVEFLGKCYSYFLEKTVLAE